MRSCNCLKHSMQALLSTISDNVPDALMVPFNRQTTTRQMTTSSFGYLGVSLVLVVVGSFPTTAFAAASNQQPKHNGRWTGGLTKNHRTTMTSHIPGILWLFVL
jgi:hypothetical protein